MPRILFVVTSDANMGDLALCREWTAELGRTDHTFGYALCEGLRRFVDPCDLTFVFEPNTHVNDTLLAVVRSFRPDAILLACNSFWSIRGQAGATFGSFPFELLRTGIPLASFDPFETEFETEVEGVGNRVRFPGVPSRVWALRYMSRSSVEPNALHFSTRAAFQAARSRPRPEVLGRWGVDSERPTAIFPVSKNRHRFIQKVYPAYYPHIGEIFGAASLRDAQLLVVTPEPIDAFADVPNVTQLPLMPFPDFLATIAACDLYVADSLISCVATAFQLTVPGVLLASTEAGRPLAPGSFLDGRFFRYRVFPYGFEEIGIHLEERFEIGGCFERVEAVDGPAIIDRLTRLLMDGEAEPLRRRCVEWKAERLEMPGPAKTLARILEGPPP